MNHRTEPAQLNYDPIDGQPIGQKPEKPRVRLVNGRWVPVGAK